MSDENEGEDVENLRDIPQSEVNRFVGRDDGAVGKLAGNVTFTDRELYGTLRDRVLESPAAFGRMVGKGDGNEDDDDDDEEEDEDDENVDVNKNDPSFSVPARYSPPSTVPDSGLTAGEVVTTVLRALAHNDEPERNHGLRVLRGYSSPTSVLKNEERAVALEDYEDFLKTSEYKILLEHISDDVKIEKADYAFDRKKSFFTMRLRPPDSKSVRDAVFVNFILSTRNSVGGGGGGGGPFDGSNDNDDDDDDDCDCWLIDSIIVRSDARGVRRRRRR